MYLVSKTTWKKEVEHNIRKKRIFVLIIFNVLCVHNANIDLELHRPGAYRKFQFKDPLYPFLHTINLQQMTLKYRKSL